MVSFELTMRRFWLGIVVLFLLGQIPSRGEESADDSETKEEEVRKEEALAKRLAEEKEVRALFGYSLDDVADKIVSVSCNGPRGRSSGSGFIAVSNGKTYLYTNQHVVMGADKIRFKTADGRMLRPRSVELSVSRDIVRLLLPEGTEGFEIGPKATIGAPIAVFGNSEGGGVATELYGRITTVSADFLSVSADFVSGNSGSPVLNTNREALGIATFVRFDSKKGEDAEGEDDVNTRRFCYRLAGGEWRAVNWKKYNEKYGKPYCERKAFVEAILESVGIWYAAPFARMPAKDHPDSDLRKWSADHNRMINHINRLSEKGRCSRHELDLVNKGISKDISDSADALSVVCRRRASQMRLFARQRELSGFLRKEYERLSDVLELNALKIDLRGKELSAIHYFHFE